MKKIIYSALALFMGAVTMISCSQPAAETVQPFGDFRDAALTPPMGWNSWDCYGPTVTESEVKAAADYMEANLKEHGWEYVVVDIRWFVENDKAGGYNQTDPRYVMDEWGRYQPAVNRFPSAADGAGFKPIADYIHEKGLKFGIHIMRGIPKIAVNAQCPVKGTDGITADMIYNEDRLCRWLRDNYTVDYTKEGAQEYYNSLFELYASWGVDFIKIDDLSSPYHKEEIEMIRKAIDGCGRPIVLSTSPGATPASEAEHISTHANMWRMVNDVWDIWRDVTHLMDVADSWYDYIRPGTWPDCDMIPLGHISIRGERGEDRMTRLTPDEQYSLMNLFLILRSPLMFGGDLPTMDDFTLSLLSNDKAIAANMYGTGVRKLFHEDGKLAITSKDSRDGTDYLAIFNANEEAMEISVDLKDNGIEGKKITNLWNGEVMKAKSKEAFVVKLEPHASVLLGIK